MVRMHQINNIEILKINLIQSMNSLLPGKPAQRKMAPVPRRFEPEPGSSPRQSAVLVPLATEGPHISVLLTVRQFQLHHHGGEISFPGGAVEPGDGDFSQTALREASEEIGLPAEAVQILGALTPLYISPSHHLVHPILGWISKKPPLTPNPSEVAQILEAPLTLFLNAKTVQRRLWIRHGKPLIVPCYQINGHCIWGATAMILSELLALTNQAMERVHNEF